MMNRKITTLLSLQALLLSTAIGCADEMNNVEGPDVGQDEEQVEAVEDANAVADNAAENQGADAQAEVEQPKADAQADQGGVDVDPKAKDASKGSGKHQPQPDAKFDIPNEQKVDQLIEDKQFSSQEVETLGQSVEMAQEACTELRGTCLDNGHGEVVCTKIVDACNGSALALREGHTGQRGLVKWALDLVQDVLGIGPIAFDLVNCVGKFASCILNPSSLLSPYCVSQLVGCVANDVLLTSSIETIDLSDTPETKMGSGWGDAP